MSQMTAVGVIAKGSRDACIALARILLPDGCQLTRKGDEWEISFAVESRPVMLTDDPWNGLECGIPMIRYEDDDYNEYDEEDDLIVKQSENVYIVDGMAELDDLEELLHIDFEEEDYDTLNGYLIECLDRIPAEDEHPVLQFEGYNFTVLSVDNNIIQKVRVEKRRDDKGN